MSGYHPAVGARRPRIVLAMQPTGGGVPRHVVDLAEGLPARGFDVLLLHSREGLDKGVADRLSRAAEHGYRAAPLDLERAPGLADVRAASALRRAIREFGGADVLHGHSSKAGALARLSRWGRAGAVVYTPHGFYTQNPALGRAAHGAYGFIERALATTTDVIVSVSEGEARHAVGIGIPRRKLLVIENGIEPWSDDRVARARAAARARLGLAPDDVAVGFLGRLAPPKAPEVALRVFRRLLDARPALRPVLVGDGPEATLVRDELRAMGIADRVQWLTTAHGPTTIPAFDVFLMTSRNEAFPYVLLEALASGCAVVTTRVPGAAECVAEGENGHVVDGLDDAALAARVLHLTDDPSRLAAARACSRRRASIYTLDRMVDRTADLYRTLL